MTMPMGVGPTGKPTKLSGTGYKALTTQNFTPEQLDLFRQAFGHLGPESYLGKLASGREQNWEQLEAPALKQFGALQGNIGSRFAGMGSGALKSSGFYNTMNTAAQDFAQQLQSQRMGLQRQAIQDLLGMSSQLLGQRPYETAYIPEQQKEKTDWFGKALGIGLGAAGAGLGGAFGGLPGAKLGGTLGFKAGSAFF